MKITFAIVLYKCVSLEREEFVILMNRKSEKSHIIEF